jgi:DNA-directed RNA polymerase specialized sigma24 family protein
LGDAPGDPDGLVNETFERLWRAIPPDRFAEFPTLGGILEYLKRCARCVAVDARRREERKRAEEAALARLQALGAGGKPSPSEQALDAIVGEQLIERARERLHGLGEQLVFRASFEWDLQPGTIAERWPGVFASAREVSRIKERILRRLRRDRGLRTLLGMND